MDTARDVSALSAGALALQLLGAGARGAVIAKFEHSLYVRFDAGAFVCIGAHAVGAGPLNILLARDDWLLLADVPLGERVELRNGTLHFADQACVGLAAAAPWRPRDATASSDAVAKSLPALLALAEQMAPPVGLSRLAFAPASGGETDPLLHFARPAWDALECWLKGSAAALKVDDDPAGIAGRLIGLGPGLTPSGDDVFCGVLVMLRLLALDAAAARLWCWLEPQLEQRTSALSAAHLRAAAAGQGHEALHAVLESIMTGDAATLEAALRRLGGIGHSSGWDALAGVALVCRQSAQAETSRIASSAA